MKKLLVFALMALGVASGYSQGTVDFNNGTAKFSTTAVTAANGHADRFVYASDNTTKLSGTNWVVQMYYNAGSGQAESSLHVLAGDTFTAFRVTTTSSPGTWSAAASKSLTDVLPGGVATLQARVWDGSLFSTYDLAKASPNAFTGKSNPFDYVTGGAGSPPSTPGGIEGMQSFTVQNVPEPTTIALGVLGAASLFVVRRRK